MSNETETAQPEVKLELNGSGVNSETVPESILPVTPTKPTSTSTSTSNVHNDTPPRSSMDKLQPNTIGIRRPHSPSNMKTVTSNTENESFASSSSYQSPIIGSEQRERLVSPTKATFETSTTVPMPLPLDTNLSGSGDTKGLGINGNSSPLWSPAIDGKKEPSIKPISTTMGSTTLSSFDSGLYSNSNAQSRARSPYQAVLSPGVITVEEKYSSHPLTGLPNQVYNQTTAKESRFGFGENFTDSTAYWLGLYFFFNLGLTLFNKIVLVSFPFPYTLTGLHALSGCAGTYVALERGAFTPARLTQKENLILAGFSVLYTINIAVSNISLQLVTVPFHQVVRASTPLFTIVISTIILRTKFSMAKLVSLLPVIAGVGFATYGDYYFTAWGLILTLLGTFLAALKTVVTNVIQTGGGGRLKLHPLDLLMRMSPLAFIQCVAYGWYTGELERVRAYGATRMTRSKAIALLINGIIACGLNIVSFTANKKAGALTMTVSANCKQVLTIALAVVLFNLSISFTNGVGILLTLIGGAWYGWVEYSEKKKKTTTRIIDRS